MLGQKTVENLHAEVNTGFRKIIIDASETSADCFEVMAMYDDGDEIESRRVQDSAKVSEVFRDMLTRYALPLQKNFVAAGMEPGEHYTIFHLGHDVGFPMAQKITYEGLELTKYAQYNDAVKLTFKPFKKRNSREAYFYNESFIICKGWHDLNDSKIYNTVSEKAQVKTTISKYACFDARYIEDAKKYLPDIVSIHECYKTSVNGRLYA